MTFTCPKGHASSDADYCSICGAKIAGAPSQLAPAPTKVPVPVAVAAPVAAPAPDKCPVCATERQAGAKFCEVCRFNFETGSSQAVIAPTADAATPIEVASTATPRAPEEIAAINTPTTPSATASNTTVANANAATTTMPGATGASSVVTSPEILAAPIMIAPISVMPGAIAPIAPDAAATPPVSIAPIVPAPTPQWELRVDVDGSLYTEPDPNLSLPQNAPPLSFPLFAPEVVIGRLSTKSPARVEVPVFDPGISGRHAQLSRNEHDAWTLRDLGSTNGTRVNGQNLAPGARAQLRDGDEITLGCWTRLTLRKQT